MELDRLLEPRSIAVVGATDRPGAYGDIILRNLERLGFDGPVWGVNPKRDEIRGIPCFASLADLPEPADAVAVAVPAPYVPRDGRIGGRRGVRRGDRRSRPASVRSRAGANSSVSCARPRSSAIVPGLRAERQRDHLLRSQHGDLGRRGPAPAGRVPWR